MIVISVARQILIHRRKFGVRRIYPISTAKKGVGNCQGSFQTPIGRHQVIDKIGEGQPRMTVFKARNPEGIYRPGIDQADGDWILSRILRLGGCQTGYNHRGQVDSYHRYIYIHGTQDEAHLGTPASHGCIRMNNDDVIDLFSYVDVGERVYIRV
ncbi:MAG: L,D-transpeptidase [Zetaproteobacteria bacterium]|nr:L,D-transpeptidase [Zetaproteobacteria bacterium]